MCLQAPAKINLYLDVLGKRPDGYHELKMIMQTIDLCDEIHICKISEGIKVSCDSPYVPDGEKNIAYKAAKLMLEHFNIKNGVNIKINKRIPAAAGLAGGSTDAAAVMKGINQLYKLNKSDEELSALGVKVGADVPFCIVGGTAYVEGLGEKITRLKPFSAKNIVLVKPDFGVSTAYVFNKFDNCKYLGKSNADNIVRALAADNLFKVGENLFNALEVVTAEEHPIIKKIKKELMENGAAGSLMTGSGPTVFGIFDDETKAKDAYGVLKKSYFNVYLTQTV